MDSVKAVVAREQEQVRRELAHLERLRDERPEGVDVQSVIATAEAGIAERRRWLAQTREI